MSAAAVKLAFGQYSTRDTAETVWGVNVRLGRSRPVALIWAKPPVVNADDFRAHLQRIRELAEAAVDLGEFLTAVERSADLNIETDEDLYWSLVSRA